MKLEIEITEDEIKTALERKVRVAIADQTAQYSVDAYIKEQVKLHWQGAVDSLVKEALLDTPRLKEKVANEIEKKLKAQLNAALRISKEKNDVDT